MTTIAVTISDRTCSHCRGTLVLKEAVDSTGRLEPEIRCINCARPAVKTEPLPMVNSREVSVPVSPRYPARSAQIEERNKRILGLYKMGASAERIARLEHLSFSYVRRLLKGVDR